MRNIPIVTKNLLIVNVVAFLACMLSLKRTRVGQFEIDDSLTLNQISALLLKGELGEYIIAADDVFDYPKLSVDSEYNKLLYNGNKLPVDAVREIERTPT